MLKVRVEVSLTVKQAIVLGHLLALLLGLIF